MRQRRQSRGIGAFTFLEMLVVVVCVAILLGVVIYPIGYRKAIEANLRTTCVNNLKQISFAMLVWMNDREATGVSWRVTATYGWTRPERIVRPR